MKVMDKMSHEAEVAEHFQDQFNWQARRKITTILTPLKRHLDGPPLWWFASKKKARL